MKRHWILITALILPAWSCGPAVHRTTEVSAIHVAKIPTDPADRSWDNAPEFDAKLLPQDLVDPRLMKPSTPDVLVRAVTTGKEIAFRLEWAAADRNDLPGAGRFLDACAIQIPATIQPDLPDPQMGSQGKGVEITYWRADWQASVDGRPDTIQALFPNATVDHYPFAAPSLANSSDEQKEFARRYAPAEAVGNRRVGPRAVPVEDLVAEGPGTLSPATKTVSRGKGVFGKTGWRVVITRPLPAGLVPGTRTQVAFAVWQGAQQESGARKMRTGWNALSVRGAK
mgnify:CR=1 FL=1